LGHLNTEQLTAALNQNLLGDRTAKLLKNLPDILMFARNIRLRHLLAEVVNESLRFNLIQTPIPIKVKRYEDLATQIAHCQVI
jgi:hypothetical protein